MVGRAPTGQFSSLGGGGMLSPFGGGSMLAAVALVDLGALGEPLERDDALALGRAS